MKKTIAVLALTGIVFGISSASPATADDMKGAQLLYQPAHPAKPKSSTAATVSQKAKKSSASAKEKSNGKSSQVATRRGGQKLKHGKREGKERHQKGREKRQPL